MEEPVNPVAPDVIVHVVVLPSTLTMVAPLKRDVTAFAGKSTHTHFVGIADDGVIVAIVAVVEGEVPVLTVTCPHKFLPATLAVGDPEAPEPVPIDMVTDPNPIKEVAYSGPETVALETVKVDI